MWTSWREKSISGFEVCADCTIAVVTKAPGSLLIAKMARGFMKCQGVAFMYTYSTVIEKYGTDCKFRECRLAHHIEPAVRHRLSIGAPHLDKSTNRDRPLNVMANSNSMKCRVGMLSIPLTRNLRLISLVVNAEGQ